MINCNCPMVSALNLVIKSFSKRSVPPVEIPALTEKYAETP